MDNFTKKQRRILTPDEAIAQQEKIIKEARRKKAELLKKKKEEVNNYLLSLIAKKFGVNEVDEELINKLSLGDDSAVDETIIAVGKRVVEFYRKAGVENTQDILEDVLLNWEVVEVMSKELGSPFTKEMLPQLRNFIRTQNEKGRWFNKAFGRD